MIVTFLKQHESPAVMQLLNKSVSPDGLVVGEPARFEDRLEVQVRIPFEHNIHLEYFLETLAQDGAEVIADLRSRVARLGLDLKLIGEGNQAFFPSGDSIYFRAAIRPYMPDFLPRDGSWIDTVAYQGWKVAKLVAVRPERIATADELTTKIEQGRVRLRTGSELDGTVRLTLSNKRYVPNEMRMNVRDLIEILSDRHSRHKLAQYQFVQDVDSLVVPADGGIVTHTWVRPEEYSLLILHDQGDGIRHTQAMHVSPHSAAILHIELKGNGKQDVPVDHVRARFYNDEVVKLKSKIVVPDINISGAQPQLPYNPKNEVYLYVPAIEGDPGDTVPFMDVDSSSAEDLAELGRKIRDMPDPSPGRYHFCFKTPPRRDILQIFSDPERRGKIGSIQFTFAPDVNDTFTSADYENLLYMTDLGIEFVWNHQKMGRLFFHRVGFMRADGGVDERVLYDHADSSNSIASCFGSSAVCSDRDAADLEDAIEGWSRFTGGTGYIFNGGGPAMMTAASKAARRYSLRVGTINLVLAEQPQSENPDIFMPFTEDDLNVRQGAMIDASAVYMVFEGGLGTLFELFECATKNKLNREGKPILIIGDTDFQNNAYGLIQTGIRTRKVPEYVASTVHLLSSGAGVYDTLMQHYHFPAQKTA